MTKSEYLKEWKVKKRENDPDYFKKASQKAYEKRKLKLQSDGILMEAERKRNRDYLKQSRKQNPVRHMLSDARKRAKIKNIEFSLTNNDIKIPSHCPILGMELLQGSGHRLPNSPSLDRIDNSKGYIRGNIMVISFRANALKNDGIIDEFRKIIQYMENHSCHGMQQIEKLENE
jgi:hypothetical protein